MSTAEDNKAAIRRYVVEEAFNKGNLAALDDVIAPDFVYRGAGTEFKGPDGLKQIVTMLRTAYHDFHMVIDDIIAEGDRVAACYTYTGTHTGEFLGIPPTGKRIKVPEAVFYRFENGKEVEALGFIDMLTWFQQLGVSPSAPPA